MSSNERRVDITIKNLLQIIPKTETSLINEIETYKNSLWNQAPEAMYFRENWEPLQDILNRNILEIDCNWKKKLIIEYNGA
jgi:hypothetical protein